MKYEFLPQRRRDRRDLYGQLSITVFLCVLCVSAADIHTNKKSPGDKGRVSGAEHVPDDVHPERTPLREVERGKTKSDSSHYDAPSPD
jgi:hypothetical protein